MFASGRAALRIAFRSVAFAAGPVARRAAAQVPSVDARGRLACPICASGMRVVGQRCLPPVQGLACEVLSCELRRLECPACAMITERIHHDAFGYAPFPV